MSKTVTDVRVKCSSEYLPIPFTVPLKRAVLVIPERILVAGLRLGKVLKRREARERRYPQKHDERRGEADALGAPPRPCRARGGAGGLRAEKTACRGPHWDRGGIWKADGSMAPSFQRVRVGRARSRSGGRQRVRCIGGRIQSRGKGRSCLVPPVRSPCARRSYHDGKRNPPIVSGSLQGCR